MVEKGECILTHELHCTYIYTITYNPQLNVTHKLITHRFLITSLSSWIRSRKKQIARYARIRKYDRPIVGAKWGKIIPKKAIMNNMCNCVSWILLRVNCKGRKNNKGKKLELKKKCRNLCAHKGVFAWKSCILVDGRIFGWEYITRWEHFVTERFRGALFLSFTRIISRYLPNYVRFRHSCVRV